ncbi:hypothetical protein [Octadecabacter temperatus]|nr:hypothetical protein [Octadecabacter temperatus]
MYRFAVDENNVQREDGVHVVSSDVRVKDVRVSLASPDVIGPNDRAIAAEIVATFCDEISRRIVRDPFEFGILQTQGGGAPEWRYSQVCE